MSTLLGKPVIFSTSRILNAKSGFEKKKLCSGQTFTAGTACAYSCTYCYVNSIVGHRKYVRDALAGTNLALRDVVIRRVDATGKLANELGKKYRGQAWKGKILYASPLVDVAATKELAAETVKLCKVVLAQTDLDIRLLSKSPLLESHVAKALGADSECGTAARTRIIFGISTGTLDSRVARAVEPNAPAVERRLEALRHLQANGWRTFAMLCPVLPQDAKSFASRTAKLIDFRKCEHVWAEALNTRKDSMHLTVVALENAGLTDWAEALRAVSGKGARPAWENYAREIFEALAEVVPARGDGPRLRFLQYTRKDTHEWWRKRIGIGAVLL